MSSGKSYNITIAKADNGWIVRCEQQLLLCTDDESLAGTIAAALIAGKFEDSDSARAREWATTSPLRTQQLFGTTLTTRDLKDLYAEQQASPTGVITVTTGSTATTAAAAHPSLVDKALAWANKIK